MTWAKRTNGVYRCDECQTKKMGFLEETPVGWIAVVRGPDPIHPDRDWVEHLCPTCNATLAQPKVGE